MMAGSGYVRLAVEESDRQKVSLIRHPKMGLTLLLDGVLQFAESTEGRYHECLGVVPMLYGHHRSVFVAGGGDGLVAARLLRFPELERIIVCDHDPVVTNLARSQPDLVTLNEDSLSDPRVHVVHHDARRYLETAADVFHARGSGRGLTFETVEVMLR